MSRDVADPKPADAPRRAPPPRPARASLRVILNEVLVTDSDLEAFCLDHFRDVSLKFANGMNRDDKLNELLKRSDAAEILARLREDHPRAVAAREQLIRYERDAGPGGDRPGRRRPVLAGALGAAALCCCVGYAWVTGHVTGRVLVPGGTFTMGSTTEEVAGLNELCRRLHGPDCRPSVFEREQPTRSVAVSTFWLDAREVDHARFAAWLSGQPGLMVREETVYDGAVALANLRQADAGILAKGGGRFVARAGREAHPVTRVTWAGARRYCAARKLRLPTEAEWEFAARGAARRTFPWGEAEPRCGGVVFGQAPGDPCAAGAAGTAPAGSAPEDRTPQGVRDLGGNVAEWVADVFTERYRTCNGLCRDWPQDDRAGDGQETQRVIRGGHFSARTEEVRGSARGQAPATRAFTQVGFRCARGGVLFPD